jgi:uncharacterized SAM-binding protein YcdF (DUF218 family)
MTPRSYSRARIALLTIAVGGVIAAAVLFLGVGHWLVAQDPLQKAQAIVVLSGGMPLRSMEAARLYQEGYAPEVWLTHSTEPGETLRAMGILYFGEEFYDRQILLHEGVPAGAIHDLTSPIENTADEILAISAALRQEKDGAVIIVTTKAHTRRVHLLWRKISGNQGRAIVRGARDDDFDPGHWWRSSSDALDVVREVLGILNAWAGLPLRPAH